MIKNGPMKPFILYLLGTILFHLPILKAQNELPFKRGEVLEYRLHYGLINAGTAKIEIASEHKEIRGYKAFHAIGTGKSNSFFDFFFKVRDRYESFIEKESLSPVKFVRRVNEGGYKIEQDYLFDPQKQLVNNGEGKLIELPTRNVQDMISAFYYARSLDFSNAKEGDIYTVPTFLDDEMYYLKIKYKGKEIINTEEGKFRCLTFVPVVQTGRIFKEEEDLMVWITDDKNKIPVAAKANILVGAIRMDITSFYGIAHPLARIGD